MPKFNVTTDIDGEVSKDAIDFPSEKAATDDLQVGLADAVKEKLPDGSHSSITGRVDDEKGQEIYRASSEFRAKNATEIRDEDKQADEAVEQIASTLDKHAARR
ncbi:MAG: hypothetical protein KME20_26775 [Kaiparowitsia implicata GSE-PSE-MK54-09C]|nr:hypothetical protein [Kaiparowitsia implicata GSE-PSE-MK54-09C]